MLKKIGFFILLALSVTGCQNNGSVTVGSEPAQLVQAGFTPIALPSSVRVPPNTVVTGSYVCAPSVCGNFAVIVLGQGNTPTTTNLITVEESIKSGIINETGARNLVQLVGSRSLAQSQSGSTMNVTQVSIDRKTATIDIQGEGQSAAGLKIYVRMRMAFHGNASQMILAASPVRATALRFARLDWLP